MSRPKTTVESVRLRLRSVQNVGVCVDKGKGKGKAHPVTGHEGPEGEKRYSSTLSLTSGLDEGGRSTPRPSHFTPGKDPVPIVQKDGWDPGSVWTGAENLTLTGIQSPDRPARSESLY